MPRALLLAAAVTAVLAGAASTARADCEIALALALDISSSVNSSEYAIQKDGLAAALSDPEVRSALLDRPGGVALAVYEWSGWQQQDLIANWHLIETGADIDALAATLLGHERRYAEFSTAIGRALMFGADLFGRLPFPCARHVIDISGDGVNNEDFSPSDPRVVQRLQGVTVNALVIEGATPPPAPHYRQRVISGPGAFMMVARNGFDDYPAVMKGKLLRELQDVLYIGELPQKPPLNWTTQ